MIIYVCKISAKSSIKYEPNLMNCANKRQLCIVHDVHFTKAKCDSTQERFDVLRIILKCFRRSSEATHVVKIQQLAKSLWTGRS